MFSKSVGCVLFAAVAAGSLSAQQFDDSANAMIAGPYFVREIALTKISATGAFSHSLSAIGTVTFNMSGAFHFSGQVLDSAVQGPSVATSIDGHFKLAANGLLQMDSLVATTASGNPDTVWGGVGSVGPAAFVASATDGPNYDIIVGIPISSTISSASFKGLYNTAYLEFLGGHPNSVHNAWFTMNANGKNQVGFGTPPTGSAANVSNKTTVQSLGAVAFTLTYADGGDLAFPPDSTGSELISNDKSFYISPDGSLLLGGDPNDYDLLIATPVVATPSNADLNGFYFLGGLEDDATGIAQGDYTFQTWYGSMNATGDGRVMDHLHMTATFPNMANDANPWEWTFNTTYNMSSAGVFQFASQPFRYAEGAGGQVFLATSSNGLYSLAIGLQRTFTSSGVYLNPVGIANAANHAPATNPVAPLQLLLLSGSNLAPKLLRAHGYPLPTQLGGVSVLINSTPAPLVSVGPDEIALVIPRPVNPATGIQYATFQVMNNGTPSNPVTMFLKPAAAGIFSTSIEGAGAGVVFHEDGTLVTEGNPAVTGEVLDILADGLGTVTPGVGDGDPALPAPHLSHADTTPQIFINNIVSPDVEYAGLAPGYSGVDLVQAVVPSGTGTGHFSLAIGTPSGISTQTTIFVHDTGGAPATGRIPPYSVHRWRESPGAVQADWGISPILDLIEHRSH